MRAALIERLEAIAAQPFAKHRNVERIKVGGMPSGCARATGEPSIGSTVRRARCESWSWSREGARIDD
jgi:hypothetical protein